MPPCYNRIQERPATALTAAEGNVIMREYTEADDLRFKECLSELLENPAIQKLRQIPQHKGGTTYAHCVNVANAAYRLARQWRWDIDISALVRGAMLHDYYLYDTETMPYSDYRHSLVHPKLAVANAEKLFPLNAKERNIIFSHMWPIPGAPLPRSREAWLICIADKLCAQREMRRNGAKPRRPRPQ